MKYKLKIIYSFVLIDQKEYKQSIYQLGIPKEFTLKGAETAVKIYAKEGFFVGESEEVSLYIPPSQILCISIEKEL